MRKYLSRALVVSTLFISTISKAQWSEDISLNTPVCLANNSQIAAKSLADGHGGAFIVWQDKRSSTVNDDIYMQHLDSMGVALWATNGVAICTAASFQGNPNIASDGNGGAIVVWEDLRALSTTGSDIYAQRIDNAGNIQWAANGVLVCGAPNEQSGPSIVADNTGGAYITWAVDNRLSSNFDLFIQHIDNTGAQLWATDGLSVSTMVDELSPSITQDGNGGVIITWLYSYTNLYAQKYNTAGVAQWASNGVAICSTVESTFAPKIINDNNGGAIITWIDSRAGTDVYAQRVNSSGIVQWTTNGVVVSGAPSNKFGLKLISNGSNGAYLVWVDGRNGLDNDIYAQQIDGAGSSLWTNNGKVISNANFSQNNPDLCDAGNGNIVITWDSNIDAFGSTSIYAKKINSAGVSQWAADSIEIGVYGNEAIVVSDNTGGAIVSFLRGGFSSADVFAQHICYAGFLGATTNPIISIAELQTGSVYEIFPFGTSSASSDFFSTPASSAFDFNTTLYGWASNGFSMPEWLEHDFGSGFGQTVDTYELYFSSTMVGLGSMGLDEIPKSWFFLASNDGITWDTLDRRTNQTLAFDVVASFPVQNTTAYEKYRIYITNTVSNSVTFITELKLIQHFPNMCSNRMYLANSNTPTFYQNLDWLLNGVSLGVSNDTLILPTTNNGDIVSCVLTSSACVFNSNIDTSNTVVITTMGYPTINISGNTSICAGQSTTLTANGGQSYQWLNGPATDVFTVTPFYDSTFTVEVIDTNGCLGYQTQLVNVISGSPNISTNVTGLTISAVLSGATYQWINCSTNTAIAGETNQSFTATANGNYAVIINNGCGVSDTSACISITTVGINSISETIDSKLMIIPNPNNGEFIIKTSNEGTYRIVNELGQAIQSFKLNNTNNHSISISELATGVYFVIGTDNNFRSKIVVTK